jgi:hypothetical protein
MLFMMVCGQLRLRTVAVLATKSLDVCTSLCSRRGAVGNTWQQVHQKSTHFLPILLICCVSCYACEQVKLRKAAVLVTVTMQRRVCLLVN